MNHFFQDVYEVAKMIPRGKVTTYGAIGRYLGKKNGARMVGWAMNGCPPEIPAHRVVNSKGELSARENFHGPKSMQTLLEEEGHTIQRHKIQNFERVLWLPEKELL